MIIMLILVSAAVVGLGFLEAYLSRRTSRIPGLILPIISILFSVLIIWGLAGYTVAGTVEASIANEKYEVRTNQYNEIEVYDLSTNELISWETCGNHIIDTRTDTDTGIMFSEINHSVSAEPNEIGGYIPLLIIMFIMLNIPTIIYFTIYGSCRKKLRANAMLERMAVHDL